MPMELKIAKAHEQQLADPDIKLEFEGIRNMLNNTNLSFVDGRINFVLVKGIYVHAERKMVTACLFVNKLDKPVRELHGVLRLAFQEKQAQIAKTTVNFDEPFMGVINPNEALLVHLGIPVRGLEADEAFSVGHLHGRFEEVRVSFAE